MTKPRTNPTSSTGMVAGADSDSGSGSAATTNATPVLPCANRVNAAPDAKPTSDAAAETPAAAATDTDSTLPSPTSGPSTETNPAIRSRADRTAESPEDTYTGGVIYTGLDEPPDLVFGRTRPTASPTAATHGSTTAPDIEGAALEATGISALVGWIFEAQDALVRLREASRIAPALLEQLQVFDIRFNSPVWGEDQVRAMAFLLRRQAALIDELVASAGSGGGSADRSGAT